MEAGGIDRIDSLLLANQTSLLEVEQLLLLLSQFSFAIDKRVRFGTVRVAVDNHRVQNIFSAVCRGQREEFDSLLSWNG